MSNDPPLVAPNPTTDMFAPQIPSDFAGTPAYPSAASIFANDVQQAGQFTPGGIQTAVATGQQRLTTAPDGKPCATCDKTGPYSLAFDVKDANGKMCGEGMYYTVKYETSGEVFTGSTDANGLTERYFSNDPAEKIFLYLGHRTTADSYPTDNTEAENAYDEAPLASNTVAAIADKKIHNAQTQRLWTPWSFSAEAAHDSIEEWERRRPHIYDDRYPNRDWNGTHSAGERLTIGAGHLLSRNDADAFLQRYPTTGPGMTNAEMDALYQQDVDQRARQGAIANEVHVPLYQREFDALVDLRFNAGGGSGNGDAATDFRGGLNPTAPHGRIARTSSVTQYLNRGRYTAAGGRILSTANSAGGVWSRGVQRRRTFQRDMFFGELP